MVHVSRLLTCTDEHVSIGRMPARLHAAHILCTVVLGPRLGHGWATMWCCPIGQRAWCAVVAPPVPQDAYADDRMAPPTSCLHLVISSLFQIRF